MASLMHWPDIVQFHSLRKSIQNFPEILNGNSKVKYRGKIKLDGANMGVQLLFDNSELTKIVPQSRETLLIDGNDCYGFAAWVNSQKDLWTELGNKLKGWTLSSKGLGCDLQDFKGFCIFGEWCGKGVQNRTAISEIDKKVFVVFAAQVIGSNNLIVDPDALRRVFEHVFVYNKEKKHNDCLTIPDVYFLPWYTEEIEIDFNSDLTLVVDHLNSVVEDIEKCDPWVKEIFGKEGLGEGVVFYPVSDHSNPNDKYKNTREVFGNLAFKCKGKKHETVNNKKPVQIEPEKAANAEAFANLVLTEARLNQGIEKNNNSFEMKNIGSFLRWINGDVQKECQAELSGSSMTWKDVEKAVANKARNWFLQNSKK